MNWRRPGEDDGSDATKLAFGIGAAAGLLVLGWVFFARSGEEGVSSNGFRDGGAGGVASPFSRERRSQTGLAFVRLTESSAPSSVRPEALPGAAAAAPALPAPSAGVAPAPAGASPAGAPEAAGPAAPPDPGELAKAGLPTDPAGLKRLGSDSGLLTGAIARLLDHPRILRALLDNKTVVDALMDREDSRRNCSDAGALQSSLSAPGAGAYETQMMPLVKAALARPEAVAAMAGSEMGSRLMACPSLQGLAHNPAGLMAIATANPQAVAMVSDPRVTQALTSSAQGASLLGGVQSSVGVGGGGAP